MKQSEVSTKCIADISGTILPDCTINTKPFQDFRYSDPEFSWYTSVGVTGIEFPDKNSFSKYKDWVFVGEFINIYLLVKWKIKYNGRFFILRSFFIYNFLALIFFSLTIFNSIIFSFTVIPFDKTLT